MSLARIIMSFNLSCHKINQPDSFLGLRHSGHISSVNVFLRLGILLSQTYEAVTSRPRFLDTGNEAFYLDDTIVSSMLFCGVKGTSLSGSCWANYRRTFPFALISSRLVCS
jgi:hypothetical protein